MSWGLEYIAGFNPFPFGGMAIVGAFVFLFAFGYIANRGKSNAVDLSLEIVGYSLLIGVILFIMNLPPLVLGLGYIAGYLLVNKYVSKTKTNFEWVVFVFYILFVFAVLAVLDEFSRFWWTVFVLILMVATNEIDLKHKATQKPKK